MRAQELAGKLDGQDTGRIRRGRKLSDSGAKARFFHEVCRDGITDLADGVWRLGDARREPVVLARSRMRLWAEPSILDRVRVAGAVIRVIAPQSDHVRGSPFAGGVDWLPLEALERLRRADIVYPRSGASPGRGAGAS